MGKLLEVVDGQFGYNKNVIVTGSFTLATGEFIILEGKNGCGKSTLIKSVFGHIKPIDGEVKWFVESSQIGYIPQELHLDNDIPASAIDIVLTAFMKYGKKEKESALNALEKVGIRDLYNNRFGSLSGGQKRRVLIARALAVEPTVLILDEPTVNIDAETENELAALLHGMAFNDNMGILVTTHVDSWVKEARRIKIEGGKLYE